MQASASGGSWAIATPQVDATTAGAQAFEAGGNAIDAALHAAAAVAVTYPSSCGVGGDLFALVQRPDGEMLAVNSSGRSPAGADPQAVQRRHDVMPERGPIPITVPGAVAGWRAVYDLGAILPWRRVFARAIDLAGDGMRVSPFVAKVLRNPDARYSADPGLAAVFFPGGEPVAAGMTARQPALGRTLQTIAERGPDALYGGELGAAYVDGLNEAGSPMTIADLRAHRAAVLPPMRAAFDGLHVSVAPPNSQGFVLLQILSLLARGGIERDTLGPSAGAIGHVFAAASADRDRHLADTDHMTVHPSTLLDDGHLAGLTDELRTAGLPRPNGPGVEGDTIAIVAADAEGFAVSLIQSLFWGFGSGILEPQTGIVAHNRGACFTLTEGHPNAFAPNKRPAHTLMPVIVHDAAGLFAVAGTRGGHEQPQINAQTLLHTATGASPGEALATPRWVIERGTTSRVIAEAGVPEEARAALGNSGFDIEVVPDRSHDVGHAHLIRVGPRGFDVGSDPRSDGGAAAG
jgi:gamma-glutamyltranspeptidase